MMGARHDVMMGAGHDVMGAGHDVMGRRLCAQPATHPRHSRYSLGHSRCPCRHSRVGGNLDARRAASVDVGPILRRLPRRPGAEERRACGHKEAAGNEEQEQHPA